jgi:hypothetical protein
VPIVSGADNTWNRGTYGPVDVLYNPGGSATLDDAGLWNNRYVMYYDGTTGAFEQVGLAYSADGKLWKRYGDGPVLPSGSDWRGAWGSPSAWDSSYASYGTVMRTPDGGYRFWYSGGVTSVDQGIGYAVSADGIHWSKSLDNPIFHKSDGVAWRNDRTYTPIVLYDANGFGGNGPAAAYKLWFSGRDASNHNYAIGFAALQAAVGLDYVSGNGQSGNVTTGLSHPFVVRAMDICSQPAPGVPVTFAIAGWPATATLTGTLSVTHAVTVAPSGEVSSTITLGDVDGVYTVTAQSEGLSESPVVFTASASLAQLPRWLSYLPIIFKH